MLRRCKPSALVQRLLLNSCKGEMMSSRRAAVSIERKFSTRILGRLLGQRQSGDWTWLAVHKYLADTPGATIGSATTRQAPSKIPLKESGRALTILQAYFTCDRDTRVPSCMADALMASEQALFETEANLAADAA